MNAKKTMTTNQRCLDEVFTVSSLEKASGDCAVPDPKKHGCNRKQGQQGNFSLDPSGQQIAYASTRCFIESTGAALAPLPIGWTVVRSSLHRAILLICVSAWVLCSIVLALAAYLVLRDAETPRSQLRHRAAQECTVRATVLRA
jgi:hypothetical protein